MVDGRDGYLRRRAFDKPPLWNPVVNWAKKMLVSQTKIVKRWNEEQGIQGEEECMSDEDDEDDDLLVVASRIRGTTIPCIRDPQSPAIV